MSTEAKARIKINRFLEKSGWQFFDDEKLMWSIHNAVVVGYEGYYTAKLTLTENGIIQSTVYYEEDDGDFW